jgi:hypothetical protein
MYYYDRWGLSIVFIGYTYSASPQIQCEINCFDYNSFHIGTFIYHNLFIMAIHIEYMMNDDTWIDRNEFELQQP